MAIGLAVCLLAGRWVVPEWLETFGTFTSVLFLVLLGLLNLRAVLRASRGQAVPMVGIKGRLLGSWQRAGRPLLVVLVGALFALSFDTLSQAALFGLTAKDYGGWQQVMGLGLMFTFGMLVADGLNTLSIVHMIGRTDRMALIASRIMTLTLACLSLAVAAVVVVSCAGFFAAFLLTQLRAARSA